MTDEIDKLTLDTNVIREWWDQRLNHRIVEKLLELADGGLVDLAVTATIHADIPADPLAQKIAELPQVGIDKTGRTLGDLGLRARCPWRPGVC